MVFKPGNKESQQGVTYRNIIRDLMDVYGGNRSMIKEAFQRECDKDPMKFYKVYIEPRLPKNVEFAGEDGMPISIVINKAK